MGPAAAIQAIFHERGELSAAVELRRMFPGITDTRQALSAEVPASVAFTTVSEPQISIAHPLQNGSSVKSSCGRSTPRNA
jgi:hypothetical protein